MATGLDYKIPKPDVNDNYMNAEIILPRRNRYARTKVIGQRRDVYEDVVGRTNEKPILGTR